MGHGGGIKYLCPSPVVDAPIVEAYALKEGLMLALHIGCNRLIVQSDCMGLLKPWAMMVSLLIY